MPTSSGEYQKWYRSLFKGSGLIHLTSIGANNAESTNAVSKTDYRSKSFIALKEARESLYWIDLLYRNKYIDESQYTSIYADCEELVKILVVRCKKISEDIEKNKINNK